MNIDSNAVNERMATIADRRAIARLDRANTVYVVINPWDYTSARLIGVYFSEQDAIKAVASLKRYGDDSGNACPNVFYEAIGIE